MNLKQTDKPFRVMKLNDFWGKAVKTLDEQKLKNLMTDLKLQDKDELTLKKIKADGLDSDGIKEAQVRRQLLAILQKYGLSEHYKSSDQLDNNSDQYLEKQLFKDKKLDKLWIKAQNSGLNDEELKVLKEEFRHHEMKVKEYNQLINDINKRDEIKTSKDNELHNSLNHILNEEDMKESVDIDAHKALKDKHFEIKQSYRQLNQQIIGSINGLKDNEEFNEESVQKLWELALKSNFNKEELDSLREELNHFQSRIKKLKHFESQLELDSIEDKYINQNIDSGFDDEKHLRKKVKELNHKVNKLHNELETRIMRRHIEL